MVAVLLALGYLFTSDNVANRAFGLIGGILIGMLLKVVFELHARLARLEGETSRLTSQLVRSSSRTGAELAGVVETQERLKAVVTQTESQVGDIQARIPALESTLSDLAEDGLRAQQRSHRRTEVLREEIGQNMDDLAIRLDALVAALQPVLQDSMLGLRAEEGPD
jgi:chromosome segregation ATPase